MNGFGKLALLLILVGVGLVIVGVAQILPTLQPSSISGGAVIFIGPIPIFLGWGAPAELVLILVVIMIILTVLGFILFRAAR